MTQKIPLRANRELSKVALLQALELIDNDPAARTRVLQLETGFRLKIDAYLKMLSAKYSTFKELSTSPFVLLVLARQMSAQRLSEIESSIIPAKAFSSIETSTGKMIEQVVLPVYGWSDAPSTMASSHSSIDAVSTVGSIVRVATLKSGPRCLNDTMAERLASDLLEYGDEWANNFSGNSLEYSFAALYGTRNRSNKKDWHILRHVVSKVEGLGGQIVASADRRWECDVILAGGTPVHAEIRIGIDWWDYLGGSTAYVEVWTALVRACISLGAIDAAPIQYSVPDLAKFTDITNVPNTFNVSLLQRSQLPWFFLVAWHFCDKLID